MTSEPNRPARRKYQLEPRRVQRDRPETKVNEERWRALRHDARLSMILWLGALQLSRQGRLRPLQPELRRGFWVRYIGSRGELQQSMPSGMYGKVLSTAGPIYVLFDHLLQPLALGHDLVEVVPAPPPRHRRWHLRQVQRRWKAIRRARAVGGEL